MQVPAVLLEAVQARNECVRPLVKRLNPQAEPASGRDIDSLFQKKCSVTLKLAGLTMLNRLASAASRTANL